MNTAGPRRLPHKRGAVVIALAYGAFAFTAGFVMGFIRVALVAPAVGPIGAVALELLVMLPLVWAASGRAIQRVALESVLPLGYVAFATMMSLEFAFATLALKQGAGEFFAGMVTPAGLIGLAGQLSVIAFPLIRREQRRAPLRPVVRSTDDTVV